MLVRAGYDPREAPALFETLSGMQVSELLSKIQGIKDSSLQPEIAKDAAAGQSK